MTNVNISAPIIIYRKLRQSIRLLIDYYLDWRRFSEHNSSCETFNSKRKLGASIIRMTHGIEKGMTLPVVRSEYGASAIKALCKYGLFYFSSYGLDNVIRNTAGVLKAYTDYHRDHNMALNRDLQNEIERYITALNIPITEFDSRGGTINYCEGELLNQSSGFNFETFAKSRYSVRSYADLMVEKPVIDKILDVAWKTPSVCNRRGWHVYHYSDKSLKELLKCQNGNRGFQENIKQAFLVVGRLNSFSNRERNQVYIDGGLFSMSLLYALHSEGLAACPLNTALSLSEDKKFRKVSGMADDEVPIMMISFGYYPQSYSVARSCYATAPRCTFIS